uniref:C-type lectin domain-containing protein n=2 Tax=Poecilia mexicana TaxID=48701 RepID=A0A3B3WIE8_9TELE
MSQIQPAEMAEKEAGPVVIKSSKCPKSEAKYENDREYENVKKKEPAQSKPDNDEYAEIAAQNGVYQTLDTTGIKSDKPAERNHSYQRLACCFGTLCVILVLIIIGVCVYFRESAASELNQLKSNQKVLLQENLILTDLNNKLSSDNDNLTLASMALKNNITMLTAENHNLMSLNEKLKEQRKNLTEIIETWNEFNVSRAQWSIDQYCPKNKARSCTACQEGWKYQLHSCYAYNDAKAAYRTNWDGAREDCRTKNSDLTVVSNNAEKVMEEQ